MRHRRIALIAAFVITVPLAGAALAGSSAPERDFTEDPGAPDAEHGYAVVIFTDPPTATYSGGVDGYERTRPHRDERLDVTAKHVRDYARHLGGQQDEYRRWLRRNAPDVEVVREYVHVVNAIAVDRNGVSVETLAGGPNVAAVAPSRLYRPTMNVSVDLIGAPDLWDGVGREGGGAGVKVGVIDSGIEADHPFFGCKEEIPAKVYASGVAFDTDNELVFDHGTHVAGTIGGCVIELTEGPVQDTISGVAPAAELHDYNVFPGFGAGFVAFGGSAFSHDIAAALEDTVIDGMDVVNMSLGGSQEGPEDFLDEASNATVDAGVVVVTSAGNSGPGDSTVTSPASAEKVISVAASTNAHIIAVPVEVAGETYPGAAGDFDPYTDSPVKGADLSDWDDATDGDDPLACDEADVPEEVTDTVTLISRGACTFTTKIRNAEEAGAIGVVVYNNVAGPAVAMAHDGTDPFPEIPAVMVSLSDGETILTQLPTTTTIEGPPTELDAEPNVLAGFSSRGPTAHGARVKPEVTAPGVNIYSSVFDDGFASFQGTSMSSPHVAGGVALLLQRFGDWAPADVKSAVANTAARVILDSESASGDAGLLARGGGLLDLPAATAVPVTLDPVFAGFGEWTGNKEVSDSLDVTVTNVSGTTQTCDLTVADHDPTIVTVEPESFTLEVDAQTTYTVTLDAGRASRTPSGDYTSDITVSCGDSELLAPWWVRIDREAKP